VNATNKGNISMTGRNYVALSAQGIPVTQRATLREQPYNAANESGSFTKRTPCKSHPLRVIEHASTLTWTARGTLSNGSSVVQRSKCCSPGAYAARVSVKWSHMPEAREYTRLFPTLAHFERYARYLSASETIMGHGPLTVTVSGWPVRGDSIVIA
jgi:hypothetical protein